MSPTAPEIFIGGVPLTSLTSWGDLVITDRWPYGNWEASWTIPIQGVRRLQQLAARRYVEIRYGPTPRFVGRLAEPNWDTGEMIVAGLARQGEEAAAMTTAPGVTSSTPDTAIDNAVARGVIDWLRLTSISSAAFGTDDTAEINYLSALLDAYTTQAGNGWGVNARREVFVAATPTVPSFTVIPNSGSLGVADQALGSTFYGRYVRADNTLPDSVIAGSGAPEVIVSLTEYGPMTSTRAQGIVDSIYAQSQARTGWTNGLELTADQITTPGGGKVNLASVSAGAFGPKLMRLNGLRDVRGLSASTDIVLAETVWNVSAGTVQCTPVGMAARDLTSIIENAGGPLP